MKGIESVMRGYAAGGPVDAEGLRAALMHTLKDGRTRPNYMYDTTQVEGPRINAPVAWQSAPGHPPTMLAYITPEEARLLSKADIHDSGVDRERHYGPLGIPSFNGDGGGGDGGGGDGGGGDGGGGGGDAAVGVDSYGGAYGGAGYGGAGPAGIEGAMSGAPATNEALTETPAPPAVAAQTSMLDAFSKGTEDGIPAGSQGLSPGAQAASIAAAAMDARESYGALAEAAAKEGNTALAAEYSKSAEDMESMADTAFDTAQKEGYGQKGERTFDITNAWGNSFLDNLAYGGLGVAAPAAVAKAITNIANNPIATALNVATNFTPLGPFNAISNVLGGPTVGSIATGAGRSIAEALGLRDEGTVPEGYESADRGALATLAGELSGGTPASLDVASGGARGGSETYGGGADSHDSGTSESGTPEEPPKVTPAPPKVIPSYYSSKLAQPSLRDIYGSLGRRSQGERIPPAPYQGYNPFMAYALPYGRPTMYAEGGYVPGKSGGMDDDVPAIIDGKQPARLSSGEFVFDAATVAALGDGNNQAGAKKLDGLRKAIRKKAYGHEKQPPQNYSVGDLVRMYDRRR